MSDQLMKMKKLLRDNPQLGILVAEILGPPLGLRATAIQGNQAEEPRR